METLINIEGLYLFTQVVEAGSFAEVSHKLKIPKATLSRKISSLEDDLGVQLLVRTTRMLQPTEVGRELLQRALTVLAAIEDSRTLVSNTKKEPQGKLRVSAGVEFGLCILSPIINEFIQNHPRIDVELDLTGRRIDLIYEGFDLGIRIGPLSDSTLGSRKLGSFSYGLFAAPKLIKKFGEPKSPAALAKWPQLGFTRAHKTEEWRLISGAKIEAVKLRPQLTSNNYWVLRNAAIDSLGVVFMPSFLATEALRSKKLVPVLPDWHSEEIMVHALYPQQRFLSGKTRLFIDFLVDRMKIPKV